MKPYKRSATGPYYIAFRARTRRYQVCTGTDDYDEAIAIGIAYKRQVLSGMMPAGKNAGDFATIDQVIEAYKGATHIKQTTLVNCISALKRICRVAGIKTSESVASLNGDVVYRYLLANRTRPLSANSCVIQARSIFSARARRLYSEMDIPDMSQFLKEPLLKVQQKFWMPPSDDVIRNIIEKSKDLKTQDPAVYVTFLLSAYAGLRCGEIREAHVQWLKKIGQHWCVVVPAEKCKSGRDRIISIDESIYRELMELRNKDEGYLVPGFSAKQRRLAVEYRHGKWLRSCGLTSRMTTHEMRKIFGASVATRSGLFAAQELLGHRDPATTMRSYAALVKRPEPLPRSLYLDDISSESNTSSMPEETTQQEEVFA